MCYPLMYTEYYVLPMNSQGLQPTGQAIHIILSWNSGSILSWNSGSSPNAAVKVFNLLHSITADVEIPAKGAEEILLAHGGIDAGYLFCIKGRKLH